jgi:hypothetical protein
MMQWVQAQYARHARGSGHRVRREAAAIHERFGILDHPPSRMMTIELANLAVRPMARVE